MNRVISYIFFFTPAVPFRNGTTSHLDEDRNRRSLVSPSLPPPSSPSPHRYCDEKCRLRSAGQVFHSPRRYFMFTFFFRGLSLSVRRVAASELTITRVLPACENSVGRARQEGKHYRRLRNFPRHRARGTSCRGDKGERTQGRGMKRERAR